MCVESLPLRQRGRTCVRRRMAPLEPSETTERGQPVSSPARSILPLTALLLLTACADPQVIYQRIYVKQEIPASLLTCAPWPQPATLPADVRGLVLWLAESKAAHMDCAWRLESVRGLVTPAR